MKHKILFAIAITFFFGVATYILLRRVGSENAQERTVDRVADSPVNKVGLE